VKADDPRHGTLAGYIAGCRQVCCRESAATYERRRRARHYLNGGPLIIDALGTKRRIRALMRLGWSTYRLDAELGRERTYTGAILCGQDRIHRTTADEYAALYERLAMRIPEGRNRFERGAITRVSNYACQMGYPPPLAWDDIDNDPEPQWGGRDTDVDPVVVMRLLEGRRVQSTGAERREAMRRWLQDGGSERELCQVHGWKHGRYGRAALLRMVGEAS
jgi:hypothetical protein